jgi:hypothetical protein
LITATAQRLNASKQLFQGEGFDEVVIRTAAQTGHAIRDGIPRGEEHDRRAVAGGSQGLENRKAIERWQHDVKDGGIVGMILRHLQPLAAIARGVHGIATAPQREHDGLAQAGGIFDDEEAHGGVWGWKMTRR